MRPIEEPRLCRIIRRAVDIVYPKMELVGVENIPAEACIFVGNHCQVHGPVITEERLPFDHYTWCASQMMDNALVADYCLQDFWGERPQALRWFYWLLSRLIARPAVYIMSHARTIPVYRDSRCVSTFRQSMEKLQDGYSLVIFPECREPYNNIVHRFQDRFIDIARMYHRRSGKTLRFVPMYLAPELGKIFFGKPQCFDPQEPMASQRQRLCQDLMDAITDMACAQPLHRVVPYPNVSRREYPNNLPLEVACREETD